MNKMYTNNNVIVTQSEFLENPEVFIKDTLKLESCLIILEDDTLEELVFLSFEDIKDGELESEHS